MQLPCFLLIVEQEVLGTTIERTFMHIDDSPPRKIVVRNGEFIELCQIGTVQLDDRIVFLNVLYVLIFGANTISLSMLEKYNMAAYYFDS
jgi:hypothetical protein